jgi:putative transposase
MLKIFCSNFKFLPTVKNGLVTAPQDWEYSSFHRAVRQGMYDIMMGCG